MKRLIPALVFAVAITASSWVAIPKETKVIPQELATPSRIVVHMTEQNEPVNVYCEEIPLTPGWQAYTQDTCRRYGIDYALMLGLMETESSFRFDADSGWAFGICQIGYINEEWLAADGIDIRSKMGNIEAGCYILADYLERYTESQALMAYNMGEYGATELWEQGIYESEYSRTVLDAAEKWRATINESNRNGQERKGS